MAAPQVAEYDKHNYDYKEYWDNRVYEQDAEALALERVFKKLSGRRFIDIGGSFGRNLPYYADRYEEVVIMDYSLKTLLKYEKDILDRYPNVKLVAGNIYKFPFVNNSFDGSLMVRVLHHLERPGDYFKGLGHILSSGAQHVQEFANKTHLKARIVWILKGQWHNFGLQPYNQPTTEQKVGSTEQGIFLNFHPKAIKEEMLSYNLKVTKKSGCSYLRVPVLKLILPHKLLLGVEKLLQRVFAWSNIPPSVIYTATYNDDKKRNNLDKDFHSILACPECQKPLNIEREEATCSKCKTTYKKHSTVWDLRA